MKKSNKIIEEGAITLISLVITIIILLILSGITLNSLVGQNGIINKTKISKNEYEVSLIKEKLSLWYMENDLYGKNTDPVEEMVNKDNIKDKNTLEKIVEFQNEAENTSEINFSSLYYLNLDKLGIKNVVKENIYFMDINTKIVYINKGIDLKNGKTYVLEEKEILPISLTSEETKIGFKLIISSNLKEESTFEYEVYINNELYITTKSTQVEVNDKNFGEYNCFVKAKKQNGEKYTSKSVNVENYVIKQLQDFEILKMKIEEKNGFEGKTIKVIQDIDFAGSDINKNWTPIGNDNIKFKGTLEGNNHKISNIYNKNTLEDNQGLFGIIENATIKNVQIVSGQIKGNQYIGAIAGRAINSNIVNCINQTYVYSQKGYAGGIVGSIENGGKIENCINNGKISSEEYINDTKDTEIGGIAGHSADTTIKYCTNSGSILSKYSAIGGIVGTNIGKIENCDNTGTISSTKLNINNDATIGGIVGYSTGIISNCNNTGIISSFGNGTGGIVGIINNHASVVYCNNGNTITQNSGTSTGGIVGGALNNGKIENCINTGKIDIISGDTNNNGISGGIAGLAYKTEINLCVNKGDIESTAAYVGGIVGNAIAEITNSHNEGMVKVTSQNVDKNSCAGGIAGQLDANDYSNAKIENCYNSNTVYGKSDHVGGIASFSNGKIIDCHNTGYVSSETGIVGGIVGDNGASNSGILSTIINCYNTGKIEAKTYSVSVTKIIEDTYVGGITGGNHGNLTKCWNSGEIIGQAVVGGIAGISSETVTESYNVGTIKATGKDKNNNSALGGVCGFSNNCTISYCYNIGEIIAEYNCVGGILGGQDNSAIVTNSYNAFKTNKPGIVGYMGSETKQSQCYYIGTVTSGQQCTEADMKTTEFINLLGGNSKWKLDTNNKNNGFVILNWQ